MSFDALREGRCWELSPDDEEFPQSLHDLEPVPETLYGRGDPKVLQGPCLSVIGARRATPYGIAVAEMAGRVAAESGIVVVSGGAMGCDCAAGRAALEAGGKTVVVSGCGADMVYPASSADVYAGAVATGGAVISLERWGSPPRRYAFPKRNAIIAALSTCLFVTEAGMRSGTMSTADVAVELGRKVYGIPGSIFSPLSAGTNWLISEGARVICDEASLEAAISLDYGRLRFSDAPGRREDLGRVLSALVASPSRADDLAARLGENIITVLSALSDYEATGVVTKLPDGRYAPTSAFYLSHNGLAGAKASPAGEKEEHAEDS